MRLRPDHVIWVLKYLYRSDGRDERRGHGGAAAMAALEANLDEPVELVLGADDVCRPCQYNRGGRCTDVLEWTNKVMKQEWVERRDLAALEILGVEAGTVRPAREWFGLFARRLAELGALRPRQEDFEPDCRKAERDQALYAEGLRLVRARATGGGRAGSGDHR